ncbi:hypothetical protein P692DRAFT_20710919, partial [Suillus brevipes Sb2]
SFQIIHVIYHSTELLFSLRCLSPLTPSTASGRSLDSVNILTFASLSNENCINYRPMFAMVNDGGTLKEGVGGQFAAHQIRAQRLFIFDLLASGLAMAPLQGADFRDTEVTPFLLSCLFSDC